MRSVLFLVSFAFLACNASTGDAAAPAATAPAVAAAGAPAAIAPTTPVANWEGGSLTYADVSGRVRNQLTQMEAEYLTNRYDTESQALDSVLNDRILEAEAKKQGKADVAALLKAEVEDKAAAPTDAEIQDLYNANARRMGGRTLEEVRPDVERAVRQRKQAERFQVYIGELRTAYKVAVTLPYPEIPRMDVSVDDDPAVGPADAPVTIVQFAEFQCPYCGKARESMDQVMKAYPGKVRMVFRDFPLGFHDRAIPAAVAANCAYKQSAETYWKVHDTLMTNQRALQEPDLEKAARDAGVDMAAWKKCRTDVAMEEEVRKDMAAGEAAGVTGTPAFFINGVFLNGAQPFERFKAVIDRELAKKG
jgi:protein-disulfide isomerase